VTTVVVVVVARRERRVAGEDAREDAIARRWRERRTRAPCRASEDAERSSDAASITPRGVAECGATVRGAADDDVHERSAARELMSEPFEIVVAPARLAHTPRRTTRPRAGVAASVAVSPSREQLQIARDAVVRTAPRDRRREPRRDERARASRGKPPKKRGARSPAPTPRDRWRRPRTRCARSAAR
jgi:hypothetical protein